MHYGYFRPAPTLKYLHGYTGSTESSHLLSVSHGNRQRRRVEMKRFVFPVYLFIWPLYLNQLDAISKDMYRKHGLDKLTMCVLPTLLYVTNHMFCGEPTSLSCP